MEERTVRPFRGGDLETVLEIWLSANLQAHDFISEEYWWGSLAAVRQMLPAAEVYVCEQDGIAGFIGLQEDYIAGIFVRPDRQSGGIGRLLLDFAKEKHASLTLSVYRKNERALEFYLRQGFAVQREGTDESTGERELTMAWSRVTAHGSYPARPAAGPA